MDIPSHHSVAAVALATSLSRITGLLRDLFLFALLGFGIWNDAFLFAFTLCYIHQQIKTQINGPKRPPMNN
jgi:peptidoglycan biosynthesis protein MviN/MurJ (putative lipid II flippase)